MRKGKRKSVRAVHLRFYRLAWGGWVRTICGRHKRLWRKSPPRKRRLRQHVLCNATQSTLLDKMAGPYWTRRRYYVDDPYEPYHTREEYPLSATKPKPFDPPSGTVPYC
jgi:large subunit ribosomal protein L35